MKSCFKIVLGSGLAIILNACGGESATKYSFDLEEFKQNTKQYVLSDGQMDELGCTFAALLFTKEMLESVKEDKEPNMDNAENFSPTTINVYKDKIEWTDLGQESAIKDGSTTITANGEDLSLDVIRDGDALHLGFKDKELHCKMPFLKVT